MSKQKESVEPRTQCKMKKGSKLAVAWLRSEVVCLRSLYCRKSSNTEDRGWYILELGVEKELPISTHCEFEKE